MATKAMQMRGFEIGWTLAQTAALNPFAKKGAKFYAANFDPYRPKTAKPRTSDPRVVQRVFGRLANKKRGRTHGQKRT